MLLTFRSLKSPEIILINKQEVIKIPAPRVKKVNGRKREKETKMVHGERNVLTLGKKETKVIRKSFITINNKNKKVVKKMVSYTCKRSVSQRAIYCGKKKASKSCLTYTLSGRKCPYLIRSLK